MAPTMRLARETKPSAVLVTIGVSVTVPFAFVVDLVVGCVVVAVVVVATTTVCCTTVRSLTLFPESTYSAIFGKLCTLVCTPVCTADAALCTVVCNAAALLLARGVITTVATTDPAVNVTWTWLLVYPVGSWSK